MTEDFCTLKKSRESEVLVELLVDGVPVEGRQHTVRHSSDVKQAITVSGMAKIDIPKNAIISVRVTPKVVGQRPQPMTYCIVPQGCSITIEREKAF